RLIRNEPFTDRLLVAAGALGLTDAAAFFQSGAERLERRSVRSEEPLPPEPNREELLAAHWIRRELPPRDHLLGALVCTTSRILMFGPTGIGKTITGMMAGGLWLPLKTFSTGSGTAPRASCTWTARCLRKLFKSACAW
ncbi:MAG: hypothetical protein WBW81_08365, partial [Methylocella sp.]